MATIAAPRESPGGLVGLRLAIVLVAGVVALAGASGLVAPIAFEDPDTLKFGATIIAPLIVVVAAVARDPLRVLVGAAILLAPFAGLVAGFGSVEISVLVPALAAATLLAVVRDDRPMSLSGVSMTMVAASLLLIAPIADGAWSQHLMLLLGAGAMGFVVANVASRPGGARFALGCLVAAAAVQAAIALWEFRTVRQFNPYEESASTVFGSDYFFGFEDLNRPTAALFDPISLGNVLALSLPVAIALAVTSQRGFGRGAAIVATLVISSGLALTFSRMSWVGAIVGVAVALALLPRGLRSRAIGGTAMLALVVGTLTVTTAGSELTSRFTSIANPTSTSVQTSDGDRERLALWVGATAVAEEHPVVGVGFGRLGPGLAEQDAPSPQGVHAHSTYLQVLAEGGALGVLALVLVVGAVMRGVWAGLWTNRILFAGVGGGVAAVLVVWLTDYTVRYFAVAAVTAVLAGVAVVQRRESGPSSA